MESPVPYGIIVAGDKTEVGINGAIHEKDHFTTVVNIIRIPSLDECLKKIMQAGGKIVMSKG